jgi:creatinine amidohydrolase
MSNPAQVRQHVGDGNYHGLYERPDDEVLALWDTAVQETRGLIESGW